MYMQGMFRPRQQNLRKHHDKKSGKFSENVQKLKCLATTAADQNRFYGKKKYIYANDRGM
jgi:hypothetical protein